MQRNRILLIDDEPDTIYLLRFALERAGYDVTTVGTVAAAMDTTLTGSPDLILLDLVLGEESGLDICRKLRADAATRSLPIILVTGKLRTEFDTIEGFRAGADDYVMKPFRPAEVVARVSALLERTRRQHDTSPLTGQPGPIAISHHLQQVISASIEKGPEPRVASRQPVVSTNSQNDGKQTATANGDVQRLMPASLYGALYIDLDNFAVYNRFYGFEQGDRVLRQVASCVEEIAQATDAQAFVGHSSGDDWVIVTVPEFLEPIANAIIEKFDAMRDAWYPKEVLERGHLTGQGRRGEEIEYPLISLSAVGVTNELRDFRNPLELAAIAAETRRALKVRPGSHYLKDRRADPTR